MKTAEAKLLAFIRCEVLPYTPDAWIKADATKIGYEISADILAIEKEAGGLLNGGQS